MTLQEFSNGFDLYYNNITSNQAPGLNEWEKSMFLTKAEKEIVLNHFTANSKGNNLGQGFDDSAKRQIDFSVLMKTSECHKDIMISCTYDPWVRVVKPETIILTDKDTGEVLSWDAVNVTGDIRVEAIWEDTEDPTTAANYAVIESKTYKVDGYPFGMPDGSAGDMKIVEDPNVSKIDLRSRLYSFPEDTFIIINESIYTNNKGILQVIPLRYDEYTRLMSKPFKRPLKNQAWRLLNSGETTDTKNAARKYSEIIVNTWDETNIKSYNVRYIRVPKPIILTPMDGLSIDGYLGKDRDGNYVYVNSEDPFSAEYGIGCELDPILHEEILQRAVELAKIAWTATGQDNAQLVMQSGQRSE